MDNEYRLIRKIQKYADRTAADELVRAYYDEIYRYLRKQLSDGNTALDLTQEVFISVLRSIKRYDPKKGASFRTWVYKIATDKTIDYFRSRTPERINSLDITEIEIADETDFTMRFENRDFSERVCKYVGELPPDTQKIFRLHIFGGYTFAEIAEQTQMPESSVKTKYYRLLSALRKEFAEYE